MNFLLDLPLEARLALLALSGVLLGTQINRAIYTLAWYPRPISPWSPAPVDVRRPGMARVPIIGWLWLRGEAELHGRGFWIRPLLLEIFCGIGLAALYWWEITGHLVPTGIELSPEVLVAINLEFFAHMVLFGLMLVATFIDFDEQTIPDEITVVGTYVGLGIAALLPISLLPTGIPVFEGKPQLDFLRLTSPQEDWPAWLSGTKGLWIGLACYLGWWLAILPKTTTLRRGPIRGLIFMLASMGRNFVPPVRPKKLAVPQSTAYWRLLVPVVGCGLIAGVWLLGSIAWQGLLSALVGMAFGGGLIWGVRIVGSLALGREAMGFGDVTLLAMIGTFVGWQGTFMVFFLAPIFGVLIAVAQKLLRGDNAIAFGPFLCAGAAGMVIAWRTIWEGWGSIVFRLGMPGMIPDGWLVPVMVAFCLPMLGLMLMVWRWFAERVLGRE